MKIDLNNHTNNYGIYFNHYNHLDINTLIETFNRRIDRFYKILENNKKIIFFYSNELCIYNKSIRDLQNINYENLKNIDIFLTKKYKNINYKIINFTLNNTYENTLNIINIKIDFDLNLFSDNMEMHIQPVYDQYRNIIAKKIEELIIF
jgi:hypothetical protein